MFAAIIRTASWDSFRRPEAMKNDAQISNHPMASSADAAAALPRTSTWLPVLIVLVITVGALVIHAATYLPFISDDALISLRYSQRLLNGQGLTWTEGPRVE